LGAVDNSLRDSAGSFIFSGMKNLARSFTVLLLSLSLIPTAASAEEVCVGSECSITFEFTGSEQQWSPPANVTTLMFTVTGASGAGGGSGGLVTGELTGFPQTLYLYVGGQGAQGNGAAGGFNGGGNAGGYRGNEGSGGGASDIRFGTQLVDRVVVAGGGGGGGGYAGAAGADGGGLLANDGSSGQGGGGRGGTQTGGGAAGYSNGGSAASAGTFGVGGTGGSSWNAGGGGGGGGWYGGGGGGADDDGCCSDGGGGGGGSSYANESFTSSVSHEVGVQSGNGRIVISWTLPIEVLSFDLVQVDGSSLLATFLMNAEIGSLDSGDFLASPPCQIGDIVIEGQQATMSLVECLGGPVSLELRADYVGEALLQESVVAETIFDLEPPSFQWQPHENVFTAELTLGFELSEPVAELGAEDFQVQGCLVEMVEQALLLSECAEGPHTIELIPFSLIDQWGNSGPAESVATSFSVDITGPEVSASEVSISGENPFRYTAELSFSEPLTLVPSDIPFSSEDDCQNGLEPSESGLTIWADCSWGSGFWTIAAFSLTDQLGNLGPSQDFVISFSNPEPLATEEAAPPDPVQTPPPIADPNPPVAIDEPTEQESPVGVAPELETEPEPEPETEAPSADEINQAEVNLEEELEKILEAVVTPSPVPAAQKAQSRQVQTIEPSPEPEPSIEPDVSLEPGVVPLQTGSPTPRQVDTAELVLDDAGRLDLEDESQGGGLFLPALLMLMVMGVGFAAWRAIGR
jgi:hypothetical protein